MTSTSWVSDLVTHKSWIMFVRDITPMAQKAAPFLSFDADPYRGAGRRPHRLDPRRLHDHGAVPLLPERLDPAAPPEQRTPGNYNYVRNSVKVVIDAYSGQMAFYAMDNDPILRA